MITKLRQEAYNEVVETWLREGNENQIIEEQKEKINALHNIIDEMSTWIKKSHHQDNCENRYNKKCTCGKYRLETFASVEQKLKDLK